MLKKRPNKKLPTPTKEQARAIEHSGSPLLVLAGPGTGKTTVLALRVLDLLKRRIATRQEILAVTFTTKAAAEMRERLSQYGLRKSKQPWIGTLHSVAKRVLHEGLHLVRLPDNFLIANGGEVKLVVSDACIWTANELGLDPWSVKTVVPDLKKAWHKGLVPREVSKKILRPLYKRYQSLMRFYRGTDFDALLIHALTILRKSRPTLLKYQKKARSLLVDEYQDINGAQHQLLKMLLGGPDGIFAVGDDDQSIYSWRGGDPGLILDFARSFPGASRVTLTASQRCPGHILSGALAVVSRNKRREYKDIKSTGPDGEQIRLLVSKSENAEARWIADWIEDKVAKKVFRASDITVLSTDPAIAQLAYAQVVGRGLRAVRRAETPLSSAPVARILSILRTVADPSDNLAVRRSLEEGPIEGIGQKGITKVISLAERKGCPMWEVLSRGKENGLSRWGKPITAFVAYVNKLRKKQQTEGLPRFIRAIAQSLGVIEDDRAVWLVRQAEDFSREDSLKDFLEYIRSKAVLDVSQEDPEQPANNAVMFFTTYLVKGLEAKVVFIVGLEEGLFPDPSRDIEEQRRLFYVAMTRAKVKLYLCTSRMRKARGFQFYNPSPFIGEIPKQHVRVIYNM